MRNCTYALMVALLLIGCKSTEERAIQKEQEVRREQVERILERTITTPGATVKEEIIKYVELPKELVAPCPVTHNKDRSVGEYVRVANENTGSLEDCAARMDKIRELQPD